MNSMLNRAFSSFPFFFFCLSLDSFRSLSQNPWDLADEKQLFSKRTVCAILY